MLRVMVRSLFIMARFFVPAELWESKIFPESEARHASQVLRLSAGEQVEIFDGTGHVALVELTTVAKRRVKVKILRSWNVKRVHPEIHLLVALVKNERFDWLVQKATELGAASVRPMAAARSVVKISAGDVAKRRMKWKQIAIEAAKQCGHVILPEIFPVVSPVEAFRHAPEGLKGIPVVASSGKLLPEFFSDAIDNVSFAIGPEGDWTSEEIASAQAAGFMPLDLGQHVLRSETAALYVLSAASHHFLGGVGGRRATL